MHDHVINTHIDSSISSLTSSTAEEANNTVEVDEDGDDLLLVDDSCPAKMGLVGHFRASRRRLLAAPMNAVTVLVDSAMMDTTNNRLRYCLVGGIVIIIVEAELLLLLVDGRCR